MRKGLFITFEGGDGSGKSTQISLLNEELKNKGYNVLLLREPGSTNISEKIRNLILDTGNTEMTYKTEAFLYAASRAQLVEQVIEPALHEGTVVICDRFVDSSLAYQAYGRKLGKMVWDINSYAITDNMPDITFWLNVDPEKGKQRISGRELDRIELASEEFHNRVQYGYAELAKKNGNRIVEIDANQEINVIAEKILNKTLKVLRK